MKNIDLIYDSIDQAAMLYYEVLGYNYLKAIIEINKNLNYNEYDYRLADDVIEQLNEIYDDFLKEEHYNEEIRMALQLLTIKGLKHINYPLNLLTPDFINYLFTIIVNGLFRGRNITIIDTMLGVGNTLSTIVNNYDGEIECIGIEYDATLAEYASAYMDLQGHEIKVYLQDAVNLIYDQSDLVIGDLEAKKLVDGLDIKSNLYTSGIRYLPYIVLDKRLDNMSGDSYFAYLIDNDFFNQDTSNIFKKYMDNYITLCGIIALPNTIFQEGQIGKSILIGKKGKNVSQELLIVEIDNLEEDSLRKSINKIKLMLEKI